MIYSYSQTNRLEEPHAYMYTPFQGEKFLDSYLSSRMDTLRFLAIDSHENTDPDFRLADYSLSVLKTQFNANSSGAGEKFQALSAHEKPQLAKQSAINDGLLAGLAQPLSLMTTGNPVTTLNLSHALIASQLLNKQDINIKEWLDRLVQRFEVTKKLYETYLPGFRKGEGSNKMIRLYWLFALALCLYYARSLEIKYLSTLLKVSDLLCSLPVEMLQRELPETGLRTVLATEIISVQLLAEKKGLLLEAE